MLNEDNHFIKVCKKLGMIPIDYCAYTFGDDNTILYANKPLIAKSSKADIYYSISIFVDRDHHYSLYKINISCDYITSQSQIKIIQEGIRNKNKFAKEFIKELNKGEK